MSTFIQTPHPLLPFVSPQQFAADFETARALLVEREKRIQLEKEDPIRYGYEPEHWQKAEKLAKKYRDLLVLGGNRSGKSTWAGKMVVRTLLEKPNSRVWCFQTTNDNSISMQQPIVWNFMPRELRTLRKNLREDNEKLATISRELWLWKNGKYQLDCVAVEGCKSAGEVRGGREMSRPARP